MKVTRLAAPVLLSAAVAAHASPLTDTIHVNATGNGQTVSLSYTLTFDPTLDYGTIATAGLSSFSYTNSNPAFDAAFDQPSVWQYTGAPDGSLEIGTAIGGQLAAQGGTDSYLLNISDPANHPSFVTLVETNASGGENVFTDATLTVTSGQTAAAVTPEPSSLLLLGTGLLGGVGLLRRRKV